MSLNVEKELAALRRMTVGDLRARYAEVFGEPTNGRHKDWLVKRIIWRMQAVSEGDLTERARRRAEELANDADLSTTAQKVRKAENRPALTRQTSVAFDSDSRLPMAGSNIKRLYKGREIVVRVLPKGFEHEGEVYRTLSAVAKAITGTHWNGYHFFNLKRNGGDDE